MGESTEFPVCLPPLPPAPQSALADRPASGRVLTFILAALAAGTGFAQPSSPETPPAANGRSCPNVRPASKIQWYGRLVQDVDFPDETSNLVSGLSRKSVKNTRLLTRGSVVEILYKSELSCFVRDPASRKTRWVPTSAVAILEPSSHAHDARSSEITSHSNLPAAGGDLETPSTSPLPPAPKENLLAEKGPIPSRLSKGHCFFEQVPFSITARILKIQKYPLPGQKGGYWSAGLSPVSFLMIWGPYIDIRLPVLENGCGGYTIPIFAEDQRYFLGDIRFWYDDPEIKKLLLSCHVDQVVHLEGALVRVEHPRQKATPAEGSLTGAFSASLLVKAITFPE